MRTFRLLPLFLGSLSAGACTGDAPQHSPKACDSGPCAHVATGGSGVAGNPSGHGGAPPSSGGAQIGGTGAGGFPPGRAARRAPEGAARLPGGPSRMAAWGLRPLAAVSAGISPRVARVREEARKTGAPRAAEAVLEAAVRRHRPLHFA